MKSEPKNKNAVLSGATRGMGREVSLQLAKAGYNICLLTHNLPDAQALKAAIEQIGPDCYIYPCKVEDDDEALATFQTIEDRLGSIDLVFTNMGLMPDSAGYSNKSVAELSGREWRDYLATALMGVVNSTRLAVRFMQKNEWGGYILDVAPWGETAQAKLGLYTTSRGAIRALVETVNVENSKIKAYLLQPHAGRTTIAAKVAQIVQ